MPRQFGEDDTEGGTTAYAVGWVLAAVLSYWESHSLWWSFLLAWTSWAYVVFAMVRGIWRFGVRMAFG